MRSKKFEKTERNEESGSPYISPNISQREIRKSRKERKERGFALPDINAKKCRQSGFGFGSRTNFVKRSLSPSPGTYSIPSVFDEYERL
jgi:hypothetical protein